MKQRIVDYFDLIIPNPKCELNYNKDYELVIATMLSAQTTDKRVNMVTSVLFERYDSLEKLANANIEDIKNIIRPIGTFNKKASNVIAIALKLLDYGYVPNDREFLESLSGVGRKTTNVVLSNLYNENVIAVDTHVNRVAIRLKIAKENDNGNVVEKKLMKFFDGYVLSRLHHQLVLFGRYFCKAKNPSCESCCLKDICKK